jgi:hypothetical protein
MKNEYLNLIDKEYEFGCEMHLKIFLAIKKEKKKKDRICERTKTHDSEYRVYIFRTAHASYCHILTI